MYIDMNKRGITPEMEGFSYLGLILQTTFVMFSMDISGQVLLELDRKT